MTRGGSAPDLAHQLVRPSEAQRSPLSAATGGARRSDRALPPVPVERFGGADPGCSPCVLRGVGGIIGAMHRRGNPSIAHLLRSGMAPVVTCLACGRRVKIDLAALAARLEDPEKMTMSQLLGRLRCRGGQQGWGPRCGGHADPAWKAVAAPVPTIAELASAGRMIRVVCARCRRREWIDGGGLARHVRQPERTSVIALLESLRCSRRGCGGRPRLGWDLAFSASPGAGGAVVR